MPSLVVTPFSKKQPPPNDRPTDCTLCIATSKASMVSRLLSLNLPFQSDHICTASTGWLMVIGIWGSVKSGTCTGFDHQNCVKKPVVPVPVVPDAFGDVKYNRTTVSPGSEVVLLCWYVPEPAVPR